MKDKHPELFKALVKDMGDRYESVLHETILNFVVVPNADYVNPYVLDIKFPV